MKLVVLWTSLCAALPAADTPQISANEIVNAADYSRGRVAPGDIVVLFPKNVGPAVLAGAQLGGDHRVTTSLGDTRVLFDGIPAPMAYSVTGEVGAVVPYGISKTSTQVVIEYQGVRSAPVIVKVVESAPALFTLDSTGKGQAAMLNEMGCCNSARDPEARGSIAVLYATGAGQTVPASIDGEVSTRPRTADYPRPDQPVQVTVGGVPAEITYAGAAPNAVAGLLQVNFRVPATAPIGDAVPLVLTVGDHSSPDGVTMAVRSERKLVLAIDPEPTNREWLSRVLTAAGYEVLTARNGDEAQARTRGKRIDLVITSLAKAEPAIHAFRTVRPQLKVIATAGALDPATLKAADLMGAQAILTRPLGSRALLQRVADLLKSRPVPYAVSEEPPAFPASRTIPH